MSASTPRLNTYLNFGGNCREAFRFYEQRLGAKIESIMTFGEMPEPPSGTVPPESKDLVLHASLRLGEAVVMASDVPPPQTWATMRSAYLALNYSTPAEAERAHAALAEGAEIFMPLAETFFAHRFSMLRDRFGINWMIVCNKPIGGKLKQAEKS